MNTMKMTMKTLLALMAGIMTFSACSNENILNDEKPTNTPETKGVLSFTAFTESDAATRATIEGFDVKWEERDKITVFGDNSGTYKLTEGAGSTSGKFEVQEGDGVEGTDFYAVCPAPNEEDKSDVIDEAARSIAKEYGISDALFNKIMEKGDIVELDNLELEKWHKIPGGARTWILESNQIPECTMENGEVKNGFLPIVQTVDKGQVVDPKAVLMVAKADENKNLYFKNICAYIKVKTTKPCKKIVVRAHNDNDHITGSFDAKVSAEPEISSSKGLTTATLQAENGDLAAMTTYYIAVLPSDLINGLSVKFYMTDEYYTESTTTARFILTRNHVYDGGEQPDDPTLGTTGEAEIKGTTQPMKWVQLWAGGPRFATKNVQIGGGDGSTPLTFDEATKTGSDYVWGPDWYTPSMEEMEELMKATEGKSEKVKCEYGKNSEYSDWGFTFTGLKEGYTENSVFFSTIKGDNKAAEVNYGLSSVSRGEWMVMLLQYDEGVGLHCRWDEIHKTVNSYIRPVLKR